MRATTWVLVAVVLIGLFVRIASLVPPGYSLDEEITTFAVHGIRDHGLPLFPSGALNERGIAYSYAAWAAGRLFGNSLTSFRLVSVLVGIAALLAVYAATRLVSHELIAVAACALLALFPTHIEASGWARFYSLSSAAYAASVLLFLRTDRDTSSRPWFLVCFAVSVLTHELAVTLTLLPMLGAALDRNARRAHLRTLLGCAVTLVTARAVLVALHFLAPNQSLNPWLRQASAAGESSFLPPLLAPILLAGPGMALGLGLAVAAVYVVLVRYARAPAVMCGLCLLAAASFQLGVLLLVTLVAALLRPERVRAYLLWAGVIGFAGALFWTLHTSIAAHTVLSVRLFWQLSTATLRYPWDAFHYFQGTLPLTTAVLGSLALFSVAFDSATDKERRVRTLLILTIANLVLLGVLNVPLNSRYVLVFWPLMLVVLARALDLVRDPAMLLHGRWKATRWVSVGLLLTGLTVEQYRYGRYSPLVPGKADSRVIAVPRVDSYAWPGTLSAIPGDALVVSNDELATMYHIGRIDYWLVGPGPDYDQYAIPVAGERRGLYANARAVLAADLRRLSEKKRDGRPMALVLFDTGRFGFASSRQMAIEISHDTPHSRVIEAPGIFVLLWP